MIKYKVLQDNSRWGEVEVDGPNGERLILNERQKVYGDDYNSIYVWQVDCLDEKAEIPDRIYQLSYMPDGYSSLTVYVDEDAAMRLFDLKTVYFLRKDSSEIKHGMEYIFGKLSWAREEREVAI